MPASLETLADRPEGEDPSGYESAIIVNYLRRADEGDELAARLSARYPDLAERAAQPEEDEGDGGE